MYFFACSCSCYAWFSQDQAVLRLRGVFSSWFLERSFGGVTVNLWMGGTSPASTSDRHSFFSLRGQSPVHYSWFQWIPLTECSKKLQTIDWVMSKAKIWLLIRFSILLILNLAVSCLDRVWAWWPSEPRARMAWAKKKIVDRVWARAPRISSFWKRSIT